MKIKYGQSVTVCDDRNCHDVKTVEVILDDYVQQNLFFTPRQARKFAEMLIKAANMEEKTSKRRLAW